MLDTITSPSTRSGSPRIGLAERWRSRSRLHRLDRLGARLARLDAVDDLLARVRTRLEAGWTQDAWFVTVDDVGERHHVGVLRATDGVGSTRACLVAAVAVEALPGSVNGPVAQRALGAMWCALHGDPVSAVEWTTAPGIAATRARDLVHWNDAKDRRQDDVLALVDASRAAAHTAGERVRAELATA